MVSVILKERVCTMEILKKFPLECLGALWECVDVGSIWVIYLSGQVSLHRLDNNAAEI